MLHAIDFQPLSPGDFTARKKHVRRDIIEGIGGQLVVCWALSLPGIREIGGVEEYMIAGCALQGPYEVTAHNDRVTHEFMIYRLNPEQPVDFDRCLFEQRPRLFTPAFAGMQVPAGTDEDFIRCVEKRIAWLMRAPITCVYELVEPFCAGCRTDPDVVELRDFFQDDYPVAAA